MHPEKSRKVVEEAISSAESGKTVAAVLDLEKAKELLRFFPELKLMLKRISDIENDIRYERKNLEKEEKLKHKKQSLAFEFLKAERDVEEKIKELTELNENLSKMKSNLSALEIQTRKLKEEIIK